MNRRATFRGGGYVINERNQLQEDSGILFKASRFHDLIGRTIQDSEES
jgi:hypothetical protein